MASDLHLGDLLYGLGYEAGDEASFIRDLQRTLDRAEDRAERSGREAGQGFSRGMSRFVGAAALGGLIGGATAQAFGSAMNVVSNFVSDLDQRAIQIQASIRKANTVFGETLPTVQAWANENANAMGLTSQQAIGLAASAQDLLVPMGFVRAEAAEMSTELLGLSGALSEWSEGQYSSAEVSDILTKALLGERDSLKSLGISISAADVEARLAAKGQKELTGTLKQQAEAQATLELILEKSTDAQQAYADGADTLARKEATATAKALEQKDALAQDLIPVLEILYEDVLPPVIEGAGDAAEAVGDLLQGMTDASNLDPADYTFFTWLGETLRVITDEVGRALDGWRDFFDFVNTNLGKIPGLGGKAKQPGVIVDGRIVAADSPEAQAAAQEQADTGSGEVGVIQVPFLNAPSSAPRSTPSSAAPSRTRTSSSAGRSASRQKSFVEREVDAVGLELRRLKAERDAGLLDAERYEEQIAGHYRRLMGIVDQAATSQEQIDVLGLANSVSNELAQISEDTERRTIDLQKRQYEMQVAYEQRVTEAHAAEHKKRTDEAEATAERNDDLQRQRYEMQLAAEQAVTQNNADIVAQREADRVAGLRQAEATVRFESQLYEQSASEQADALQRILDESELNAEERLRLEREVQLLRARAAGEAADAIIEANRREAREIEADTRRAQQNYRQIQDQRVEQLRLSGEGREADLLAAKNALDRALQDLGDNLELRDALTETHRLRALDINARYDEQALTAERQRIQKIIEGEGELTEAKRVALIAQLEQELAALQTSENANQARVTAIKEALGTLGGQRGVDLSRLEGELTNVALSFPRAIHQGIKDNDIGGALQGALGSASDFFIDQMITGILGPIAQNLGKSVGGLLGGGGGGAAGAIGGGIANAILPGIGGAIFGIGASLLGGLFGPKPKPAAQRASETRASSGSPSITYQASTTLNFALGSDLKDPATLSEIRALAREETLATLEQLGRLKK